MNDITQNIYEGFEPIAPDIVGWNSNSTFFQKLVERVRPNVIIEVGTWKGASAINMAHACKKLGLPTKIYCVDTWLGATEFWTTHKDTAERNMKCVHGYPSIYYQFLSNVVHEGLQDYIVPIPNTSDNAARILAYHEIRAEMIYIDASHEEDDVYRDILQYSKLLTLNGVIFGDDYMAWPGVQQAVHRAYARNIEVIEDNFWVHRQ